MLFPLASRNPIHSPKTNATSTPELSVPTREEESSMVPALAAKALRTGVPGPTGVPGSTTAGKENASVTLDCK